MTLFQVTDLAVSLPAEGGSKTLFSHVSLSLEAGCIYDLVGASGSGKSTLLRALSRMMDRDCGTMLLDGTPDTSIDPALWRRRVCLVPQKPSLVPGTVLDNLLLPWTMKIRAGEQPPNAARLRDLMDAAGLTDIDLSREVARLSGGQAARVALLRAFATCPRVLLLDEVDAALDADTSHAISLLTAQMVGPNITCLRIRHRESDGFACARFDLSANGLQRQETPVTAVAPEWKGLCL